MFAKVINNIKSEKMEIVEIKGIIDIPNEEYHNSAEFAEYWSSSNLKIYVSGTPKEAEFQKENKEKKEPSAAMVWGTTIHDFLESKHKHGKPFNYGDAPINDTKGKAYGNTTKKYLDAKELHGNLISVEEKIHLQNIWQMLTTCEDARFFQEILTTGVPECSYFIETESGLKYKTRHDVTLPKSIIDYKTLNKKDRNYSGMIRRIINLHYDFSAAMYQYFEHKRTGLWKPFILVWLMPEPPYDYLLMDISRFCYQVISDVLVKNSGAILFESVLKQHENCMSSNSFPGINAQIEKNKEGFRIAEPIPSNWYTGEYQAFEISENDF